MEGQYVYLSSFLLFPFCLNSIFKWNILSLYLFKFLSYIKLRTLHLFCIFQYAHRQCLNFILCIHARKFVSYIFNRYLKFLFFLIFRLTGKMDSVIVSLALRSFSVRYTRINIFFILFYFTICHKVSKLLNNYVCVTRVFSHVL